MKIRSKPYPKSWFEFLLFLSLITLVPIAFVFDVFIVLPAMHERGSFWYNFNLVLAIFLIFNIMSNLIVSLVIDTRVDFEQFKPPPEGDPERLEWRHCANCDGLAPPRSWHCKLCDVCILRRDHHCNIVGSCIGHYSMRYFVCFTAHLAFASLYSAIYQLYYMAYRLKTPLTLNVFYRPFSLFGMLLVNMISFKLLALYLSWGALLYYLPLVVNGTVRFDRGPKYNCGLGENLRCVFGERMFLVFLSPLLSSKLPTDGYSFQRNPSHLCAAKSEVIV